MIALRWGMGLLLIYVVAAEIRYSASMRRRERERNANMERPPAPLSDPDVVSRIMWCAGLFIVGVFIGALVFHA